MKVSREQSETVFKSDRVTIEVDGVTVTFTVSTIGDGEARLTIEMPANAPAAVVHGAVDRARKLLQPEPLKVVVDRTQGMLTRYRQGK
jgi:hypothetical protein